jgi:hypothetical protein
MEELVRSVLKGRQTELAMPRARLAGNAAAPQSCTINQVKDTFNNNRYDGCGLRGLMV